jgi:hypothetical protein
MVARIPHNSICYIHVAKCLKCLTMFRVEAVIAQSVLRWATGWTIGVLAFDSRGGLGIYLFTTASGTALGPTQPPIRCVPGVLSLEVKRPGREADYSPPSSAEVKKYVELCLHSPIRLHGVVLSLKKQRGNVQSMVKRAMTVFNKFKTPLQ